MKLGIVGSRDYDNYKEFKKYMSQFVDTFGEISTIVTGGCRGADNLAEKYAKKHKIELIVYNADWNTYGCSILFFRRKNKIRTNLESLILDKKAGPLRNKQIVQNITHLIAFPTENSVGTLNTISLAKKENIPTIIHYVN